MITKETAFKINTILSGIEACDYIPLSNIGKGINTDDKRMRIAMLEAQDSVRKKAKLE